MRHINKNFLRRYGNLNIKRYQNKKRKETTSSKEIILDEIYKEIKEIIRIKETKIRRDE